MIKMPVSRLSKKMLMREYPAHEKSGSISVNSHTLLYRQLAMWQHVSKVTARHSKTDLSESIDIFYSNLPYIPSPALTEVIGCMIHQAHQLQCMQWIQAAVSHGATASHGIRSLMEYYDLDDDDINTETIFRQWQRWIRRNVDLIGIPKEKLLAPVSVRKRDGEIVWDNDKYAIFVADVVECFYDRRGRWCHRMVDDIRDYILYHHHTADTLRQGRARSAVYAQLRRTKQKVQKNKQLRAAIEKHYH